jgi:hypothetical protein
MKPDNADICRWDNFCKWAEENGVDIEEKDDWDIWWGCWCNSQEKLLELYKETKGSLRDLICVIGEHLEGELVDMDDKPDKKAENRIKRAVEVLKKKYSDI